MTVTDQTDVIAANRAAWNASASFHRSNQSWDRLVRGFSAPGWSCIGEPLAGALAEIGLSGKDVAQVCCNNGRELISLKNLGAVRAVGFDQSEEFLAQAEELTKIASQSCEFVFSDANKIDHAFHGSFDLVLITIGVFGWMPDLGRFLDNACALLRDGGRLVVHEEHPVANMFEATSDQPLLVRNSYFSPTPFESDKAIIYDDAPAPPVGRHYWFVHPLSAVIGGLLARGLQLESFQEYARNISSTEFDALETADGKLPLSYLLVAQKKAGMVR